MITSRSNKVNFWKKYNNNYCYLKQTKKYYKTILHHLQFFFTPDITGYLILTVADLTNIGILKILNDKIELHKMSFTLPVTWERTSLISCYISLISVLIFSLISLNSLNSLSFFIPLVLFICWSLSSCLFCFLLEAKFCEMASNQWKQVMHNSNYTI